MKRAVRSALAQKRAPLPEVVGVEDGDTLLRFPCRRKDKREKGKAHLVRIDPASGEMSCSCPGFAYRGRCRHVAALAVGT